MAENQYHPFQNQAVNPTTSLVLNAFRQWPLLLIGLAVGLIGGFLLYAVQKPVYESVAQIAVYKNRSAEMVSAGRGYGYIDDYVATQVEVIRSETLLIQVAKSNELTSQLIEPLPQDVDAAYTLLKSRLVITRSKETIGGAVASNSVLNLIYKGGHPKDTELTLDTIIKTYQAELKKEFSDDTRARIETLKALIQRYGDEKEKLNDQRERMENERLQITVEDVMQLRSRYSATLSDQLKADAQIVEFNDLLDLISKAGKNQLDRAAVMDMIGVRKGDGNTSVSSPDQALVTLKARRKLIAERLGPDHSEMKEIDSQIDYFQQLIAAQNPDNPTGERDLLALYEKRLQQQLRTAETVNRQLKKRLDEDEKRLKEAGKLTSAIDSLGFQIAEKSRLIADKGTELSAIQTIDKGGGGYDARIQNRPHPGVKVAPVLLSWLAIGGFAGLLLGLGLGFVVALSDKSFRSPAEIRERLGVPVVGHLPQIRPAPPTIDNPPAGYENTLVSALRPKSIEAEGYRGVRTQLSALFGDQGHKVLQVTSPSPGDGKSTLAANLAISMAQSGKKTVLLDCDFRKPRVHKLFNIPKPEVGLASVTAGDIELAAAIRQSAVENLDLLPCGPRPENPAELLSSPRFQIVLSQLRELYDFVVVDSPPLLAVSDPRVIAPRVDGVVLVFRLSKNARVAAERAREQLKDMGAALIGVVVNGASLNPNEYGYGYGYGYKYNYDYEYAEQYADTDKDS